MTTQRQPYHARKIHFRGLSAADGWRVKRYAITHHQRTMDTHILASAEAMAIAALPRPALGSGRIAAAFLGVHLGDGADLVFLSWWAHQNELHHQTWTAVRTGDTHRWFPRAADALLGCVWDIAVLCHERQAWIDTMLVPSAPDLDAYLARGLDVDA